MCLTPFIAPSSPYNVVLFSIIINNYFILRYILLLMPLVLGDDGRRLAKRNQSLQLGALRREGVPAARLRQWLAASIGLAAPADWIAQFDWARLPRQPVRFGAAELAAL